MEFIKPQMERILFDAEDIIVTSSCNSDGSEYCEEHLGDVGCNNDVIN